MEERFEFITLNVEGRNINNELREKLSDVVKLMESVPNSRQRALALTKIEEAAMWFTKGLARTDGYFVKIEKVEEVEPRTGAGSLD